jgi:hypothetical protein
LEAEKAAAEQRTAELDAALKEVERRIESERAGRERLMAENAAAEKQAAGLVEADRSVEMRAVSNHEGPERQAATLAELERLETEKAAAQQRAAEMAEAVLRAERQAAAERAGREQLLAEKAVAEQRAAELTSAARRTAELAEAERRERERLELEKAGIERRLLERSEEPLPGKRGAVERGRQPTALPSLGGRFNSDSSAKEGQVAPPPKPSSRPSNSGAFFQVDWDLADIAYESADDVLEVHQSISMTQLSLEGFPNQYCTAYIVALKKGKGRQVYVAFRLATSNRVLVYVPSSPPRNQDAYGRTMNEANKFLRVTGIETECLPLGKSSQGRTQALSQIPILRLHPRNAGNS